MLLDFESGDCGLKEMMGTEIVMNEARSPYFSFLSIPFSHICSQFKEC
jgi:hypothetical protein